MKEDAIVVAKCNLFSLFEHGVEGRKIIGNARHSPEDAVCNPPSKKVNDDVAAWRINSLRGVLGVVNPGGKTEYTMRLCEEGERADETTLEREARMGELHRQLVEERRRASRAVIISDMTQCAPYNAAELQRAYREAGLNTWRRINAPWLDPEPDLPNP
jgi:hypothetical protein